uniref:Uncharacterized protein n=1 Tax=Leersia perrieri TaxID=77586 RepID=A0A0D9VES9_9ORYZ
MGAELPNLSARFVGADFRDLKPGRRHATASEVARAGRGGVGAALGRPMGCASVAWTDLLCTHRQLWICKGGGKVVHSPVIFVQK